MIVVSTWLPPRLRALLGPNLDNVLAEDLLKLIGLVEDTDLEFKLQPWESTEGGSKECALDFADKANANGALLIVGVEEDGEGRASRLAPVAPGNDDLGLRVHQIVAQRVSPPLLVSHRWVEVEGGQVHLFAVAPTTRTPHGVAVGGSALRYPVRSGVTRRYLTEPEIADRYHRRFLAATDRERHRGAVHGQALGLVPDKSADAEPWSWLVVSAVPEFPGQLALRRELANEYQSWINAALTEFPTFGRNTTAHITPGFRRLMMHDDLNRSSLELYSTGGFLGLDGDGAVILGHLGGRGSVGTTKDTSMVYDEHLIGDIINSLGVLAKHAALTGAVGYLSITAEVVSEKPMLIGQYRGNWTGQFEGTRAVLSSTGRSEHVGSIDDLVQPGPGRVALARLLALDLLSAFGMADVQQITENGEFAIDRFIADRHQKVKNWADGAGVPTVDKLLS
jgi:hypothetical protein